MSTLDLFLPLLKVDADQRIVFGVATAEKPDRAGEICDYSSTKPYFEAWSDEARSASGGKSLGAVRAMHGRVAAGKLTDVSFDDEGKRILVTAKIVDDDEWEKVLEGVYTGVSQGGRYVDRWADPETGLIRYTADPLEISLVDLPCLPDATFEYVKDGVSVAHGFASLPPADEAASSPETRADEAPAAPEGSEAEEEPATPVVETAPLTPGLQALAKAALAISQAADRLQNALEENTRLRKALADVAPQLSAMETRIALIEAQPRPARAALRAIPRAFDVDAEPGAGGVEGAIKRLAELPPEQRALALTKLSLATPVTPRS